MDTMKVAGKTACLRTGSSSLRHIFVAYFRLNESITDIFDWVPMFSFELIQDFLDQLKLDRHYLLGFADFFQFKFKDLGCITIYWMLVRFSL